MANRAALARSWMLQALPGVECFRARSLTHSYPRHSHEGYAIGVIEEGVGGLFHRGTTSYIPSHHLVVMNPAEPHTGFPVGAPHLTWRMLYIPETVFSDAERFGVRPVFRQLCVGGTVWVSAFIALHDVLETCTDPLQQESAWLRTFVPFVEQFGSSTVPIGRGREPVVVARAKEFLRVEHRRKLSLTEVARTVGVTPAYLIRSFRRTTGITPHAWLLQVRVEAAKTLILRHVPLAEVAAETGFADQSHLTRRFKALVGLTPGQYARHQQRRAQSAA